MSRPFKSSMAAAALLLASLSPALSAQAPGGRIEVLALAGTAVPLGSDAFQRRWNPGPGGALSIGYALIPGTEVSAEVEYGRYPEEEVVFPAPVPLGDPGQFRSSAPPTSLWAAWLDGSREFLDGGVRPRLHAGVGVVSFGAARTGLGLRAGAGLDVPLSTHFSMIFDATFAHAFTQADTEGYALSTPFSYLPLRAGISWR